MADFNAAAQFQFAIAVGAAVAGDNVADVGDQRLGKVARDVGASVMVIGFIRANDKIGHRGYAAVGDDYAFESHRSEGTWVGTEGAAYAFR